MPAAREGIRMKAIRVHEFGGPEVLTYAAMMRALASSLGRRLWLVRVPVLTPRLSSYWIDLVTSVPKDVPPGR